MAQEIGVLNASSNELEIIEFYLEELLPDGSTYRSYFGMNVAKVLEIIRLPETITSVPTKHHKAALGTFNLRGRVLPLVDLGVWLEKENKPDNARKVVVSEFSSIITAFVVSGVTRIHRMTWAQIEPPGKHLQNFSHDSVNGVVRFEDRIVFLLDMEQIISSMNPELDMEARAKSGQTYDALTGAGRKILVVDDSTSIRKTISYMLVESGYEVLQAACGRDAWDMLENIRKEADAAGKRVQDYVDLIISDIEMPEMDGHSLTRKIKADPVLQKLPVILFSSLISEVVRQKGVAAGADDQLSKPDLPGLVGRVKELIDRFSM